MRIFRNRYCGTALLLCLSPSAFADNGELAYAFHADEITIDGDLKDWPETAIRYDLGRKLLGDDTAYFQTAYNASDRRFYVGLTVSDEDHVRLEDSGKSLSLRDSHILYIDPDHSQNGSAPFAFSATGDNFIPVIEEESWSPSVRQAYPRAISYAFSREGTASTYEWSFDLGGDFNLGKTIGLDNIVIDIDTPMAENLSGASMWGAFQGKDDRSARLGDVMLVADPSELGTVQGQIKWADGIDGPDMSNWRVRITRLDKMNHWVQVDTGDDGAFEFKLPAGSYRISSPFRLYNGSDDTKFDFRLTGSDIVEFDIRPNDVTSVGSIEWGIRDPLKIASRPGFLFQYSEAQESALDAFIETTLDHYQVMGASIALIVDGQIKYLKDFGYLNYCTQEPVDDETLFEAGSITKPIFGLAVLSLVERGVLDLDTPLHDYLPLESAPKDIRYKKMTARHVLSHQTGLPNWRRNTPSGELDLEFIPGTGFRYSGEAFEYLGRVVSHLTGQSLETILTEYVVQPFSVGENMIFKDDGDLIDRIAFGHDFDRPNLAQLPEAVGPAYSMQTNAKSLSQIMLGIFDRKTLSADTYEALLTEHVLHPDRTSSQDWPTYYGLGFQLIDTPFGTALSHTGLNGANNAIFEGYLDKKSGFIVLTNSDVGRQFYLDLREFLIVGGEQLSQE